MTRTASSLRKPLALAAGVAATVVNVAVLRLWTQRRRTRQHLRQLAPHLLRDIGLDPASAAAEARRPFWN